jgi:hypothetical protein
LQRNQITFAGQQRGGHVRATGKRLLQEHETGSNGLWAYRSTSQSGLASGGRQIQVGSPFMSACVCEVLILFGRLAERSARRPWCGFASDGAQFLLHGCSTGPKPLSLCVFGFNSELYHCFDVCCSYLIFHFL